MDKESVKEFLFQVISAELNVIDVQSNYTKTFKEMGADSLDELQIFTDLEEEYKLNTPDDVAKTLRTPEQVYDYIVKKLKL